MEAVKLEWHVEELRQRRRQIAMTLKHLGRERAEVERNTEWIDQNAYERRARLLAHVHSWYREEIQQIDEALTRSRTGNQAVCVACDGRIDEPALAAGFCRGCEVLKETEL